MGAVEASTEVFVVWYKSISGPELDVEKRQQRTREACNLVFVESVAGALFLAWSTSVCMASVEASERVT